VNRGELPGVTASESVELRRARKRVRQLELEVEILTKASQFLAEEKPDPKGFA
jgi:transposase